MTMKKSLEREQAKIISAISRIDSMRKGTINMQYNKTKRKDGNIVLNGPYTTLTYKDTDGKTHTESISSDKVDFYREEVSKFREFQQLSAEYVRLAEQKSILAAQDAAPDEKLKKNKKQQSNKTLS